MEEGHTRLVVAVLLSSSLKLGDGSSFVVLEAAAETWNTDSMFMASLA